MSGAGHASSSGRSVSSVMAVNYFKDLRGSVMPAHAENIGTAVRWIYAVTEAAVPTSAAACPLGIP